MRGKDLLIGITQIDNELIDFEESYKRRKANYKVIVSLAALFCLLFCVVMNIVMHLQEKIVEFEEDGKINILSLPGVLQIDPFDPSEEAFSASGGRCLGETLEDYYVDYLRDSGWTIVYGTAKNVKAIRIADKNRVWYIATFEIDVIDAVQNAQESSTIKAVAMRCYDNGYLVYWLPSSSINISNKTISHKNTGLFLMEDAPTDKYKIKGVEYSAYDFADYYVMNGYDCDGEIFSCYGLKIEVDKLR